MAAIAALFSTSSLSFPSSSRKATFYCSCSVKPPHTRKHGFDKHRTNEVTHQLYLSIPILLIRLWNVKWGNESLIASLNQMWKDWERSWVIVQFFLLILAVNFLRAITSYVKTQIAYGKNFVQLRATFQEWDISSPFSLDFLKLCFPYWTNT